MNRHDLENEYFNWLLLKVEEDEAQSNYTSLLEHLHSTPFRYSMDMDGNRSADGENLRYYFGRERGYSDRIIASFLDIRECSVLEMMVALALRIFDQFVEDVDIENRPSQWFHRMLDNLGLCAFTNTKYDRRYVASIVERFLDRDYAPNGEGGLFVVYNCEHDLRDMDIWYQMCKYVERRL